MYDDSFTILLAPTRATLSTMNAIERIECTYFCLRLIDITLYMLLRSRPSCDDIKDIFSDNFFCAEPIFSNNTAQGIPHLKNNSDFSIEMKSIFFILQYLEENQEV
jgi:hypothetical protein